MLLRAAFLALVLASPACVGVATQNAETSWAYALGDRAMVPIHEVIVSIPTDSPIRNLHVGFSVLVSPRSSVLATELSSLLDLVRRQDPRIASRVAADLTSRPTVSAASLDQVRQEIVAVAQRTLDEAISRWESRENYAVEVVVTSIFFTDGSVGRALQPRWGW